MFIGYVWDNRSRNFYVHMDSKTGIINLIGWDRDSVFGTISSKNEMDDPKNHPSVLTSYTYMLITTITDFIAFFQPLSLHAVIYILEN